MNRDPLIRIFEGALIVDNFAGGGGASTGIARAIGRSPDIAINHDAAALAMHEANHPETRHLREDVFDVEPRMVVGRKRVALAWFSPDCTYHSRARGSKPFRDREKARRRRGLAGVAVKWAEQVRPELIAVENVPEFEEWGPLRRNDEGEWERDLARIGESFNRWVARFRNLGYFVDWRRLKAHHFGAGTSRERLFVLARLDEPPVWPEPTHGPGLQPYRAAGEFIDWSIPCPSIFGRKKPLADNTLRRIARGIRRYVVEAPQPFIVPLRGTGADHTSVHGIGDPLSTVSAGGTHHALAAPLLARIGQTGGGGAYVYDVREPLTTVTTKAEHLLVAPTLVQTGYGEREGQAPRALDIRQPLGTVVAGGQKHALVAAFLARHFGGPNGNQVTGQQLGLPIGTVTGRDHHSLVEVSLSPDVDRRDQVRAFLIAYYGVDQDPRLQLPLPTVTTHDRFGLVTVHGVDYAIVDIGLRMLQPHELAGCTGFGEGYILDPVVDGKRLTKSEQVEKIGNAVPPDFAEAIVRANASVSALRRQKAVG